MSLVQRVMAVPVLIMLAATLYAAQEPPPGEAPRPARPRDERPARPNRPEPAAAPSQDDAPPPPARRGPEPLPADWAFRTLPVKHADCRELAGVLNQAIVVYRKPVLVTPYEATNTLVIGADADTSARLVELVAALDTPGAPEPRAAFTCKAVALAHASVKSAVQLLHEVQPRARVPLRIFGDERSGTVWVGGDAEAVEAAVKLLTDLDGRPSLAAEAQPAGECRVYALQHADAPALAALLGSVTADMAIDARILADPRSNVLVAVASEKQHSRLAALIGLLDLPADRARAAPSKADPAARKGG